MNYLFLKTCPRCNTRYNIFSKNCPNCGYKSPSGAKTSAFVVIIIIAIVAVAYYSDSKNFIIPNFNNNNQISQSTQTPEDDEAIVESIKKQIAKEKHYKKIPIRPLSELSSMSKDEIFDLRTRYVRSSVVFKNLKFYTPNPDVYQIEDGIPWIGAEQIAFHGANNNPNIGKGPSRNSISVNNPELLATLLVPFYGNVGYVQEPKSMYFLLPKTLGWDEENNTIKADFDLKEFFGKNPRYQGMSVYMDETNARDLGYNWMYCIKRKNISFEDLQNSIKNRPYKVNGYYHRGYSCGLEQGCNNYSPYQREMIFRVDETPAYMEIGFYKEKPKKFKQKPDITYIMTF